MASRSHLIIVIDNLLPDQLADLGHHIQNLPIPPIVTLVSTIPILGNEQSEEKQLEAKYELALAKEKLHFPAASEIVPGTNPRIAEAFFNQGPFDAMIKRGSNGQLTIIIKNPDATGIQTLADSMAVVIDISENNSFRHSYRTPVFAKPQPNGITERPSVTLSDDMPKPTI